MDFPVFKCFIDESIDSEFQVDFISLVDKPAILKNFIAFSENEKLKFSIDTEKRVVSGPAMLADIGIYRNDSVMGEYYAVFDKETILSIVQKFFKKDFHKNINLMHDPESKTSGVTVYESFLVDRARGIMPMKGYEDAADGSWFVSQKVDDDAIWAKVKSGEIKGFSVEGIFKQVQVKPQKMSAEVALEKIKVLLSMISE